MRLGCEKAAFGSGLFLLRSPSQAPTRPDGGPFPRPCYNPAGMTARIARWAVVFLGLPALAGAQTSAAPPEGGAQAQALVALRLEQRLLALDLVSYNEARERERRARERENEVLGRLDKALAGDAVS